MERVRSIPYSDGHGADQSLLYRFISMRKDQATQPGAKFDLCFALEMYTNCFFLLPPVLMYLIFYGNSTASPRGNKDPMFFLVSKFFVFY